MAQVSLGTLRDYWANKPVTATMQNAATGTGNGTDLDVAGYGVALLHVTGTFEATITVRGSVDGINFFDCPCEEIITGVRSTTITVPGVYRVNCLGLQKLRAAITSYTFGSVTVYGSAEPFPVFTGNLQLTGNSIQDSQAIPMTQAQKDIAARAYENIIDTIGAENILCLLPMWETEGDTLYDLLRRDLKFKVVGATLNQPGLLNQCVTCDGVNDYIKQEAATENLVADTDLGLMSSTHIAAQRFNVFSGKVALVVLKLRKVGSPDSAVIQLEIQEDNGGQPSGVAVATSDILALSYLRTGYEYHGFVFSTPYLLNESKQYWICLKYSDATGVDASNYIVWQYDSAGAYGQPRAFYDGATWTVTSGESHYIEVYNDALFVNEDLSFFGVFRLNNTVSNNNAIVSFGLKEKNDRVRSTLWIQANLDLNSRYMHCYSSGIGSVPLRKLPLNTFTSLATTFSKADSTDKFKVFMDSVLLDAYSGSAGSGVYEPHQPLVIGAGRYMISSFSQFTPITVGPIILTKSVLTPVQIGKLHNYCLGLRKYQEAM